MNESIAKPVVRKRKWPYPFIWILPAIVAIIAGLYIRDYLANHGPEIIVEFTDASGLRAGETKIMYRGAEVGRVTEITLTEDHKHALVHAQLDKREDIFASKGAVYWIVRPEVSQSGLSGLGTLFSGPYIAATPGKNDEEETKFEGVSHVPKPYEDGEKFILTTTRMGHVQDGSSVYYKGIEVGTVQDVELSPEADHLDIKILVWTHYARLVRTNSKFWIASGIDFKAGLFSGVQMRLDSLKAIASGGIAFATPDKDMKGPAPKGAHFNLEDEPKKEWDLWAPHIPVNGHVAQKTEKSNQPIALPLPKQEKESKK